MNDWIKSIVIFTIFSSLVMFLLPDEKYRKYIRTAIGFVMVLIVINPILTLSDLSDYLSFDYFYQAAGCSVSESDTGYYRDLMENMIEEYIRDNYLLETQVGIRFDDSYVISNMEVVLYEDGEDFEEQIRNDIAESFGVAAENISILSVTSLP